MAEQIYVLIIGDGILWSDKKMDSLPSMKWLSI